MALPEPVKASLRYARRVLKATDQWANVVTGGDVGETISARAGRLQQKGVFGACVLCKLLDLVERDHCAKAYAREAQDAR